MRLFRAYTVYPEYARQFYATHPESRTASFEDQKRLHDAQAVAWGNAYTRALAPLGYEVLEIPFNMTPLQRAWAAERGVKDARQSDPRDVVVMQARDFRPDILWYDHHDDSLLGRLRAAAESTRLVVGWMGSLIAARNAWGRMDLVLSCAPEATEYLRELGLRSDHLHHAFDQAVLNRLGPTTREVPLTFIGSILRRNQFHLVRDDILTRLVDRLPLEIYTPSMAPPAREYAAAAASAALYLATGVMRGLGLLEAAARRSSAIRRALLVASPPHMPVNRRLRSHLRPAVFGMKMYQLERDSSIVLNIHADSSPDYASNMRLFEVAGVGSCLLTDWRKNIAELFEPDREVVTYRSPEECAEKARWLLDHPAERMAIARAGQARVLKEHTFEHRATTVDAILRRALERRMPATDRGSGSGAA